MTMKIGLSNGGDVMTKEDKIKAFEMRLDGCTYEEIGKCFGVSKQNVQQMLTAKKIGVIRKKSVYPAIDVWLFDNGLSWNALGSMMSDNVKINDIYKIRDGKRHLRLDHIKAILKITGMTFEEAFGEVIANEQVSQ